MKKIPITILNAPQLPSESWQQQLSDQIHERFEDWGDPIANYKEVKLSLNANSIESVEMYVTHSDTYSMEIFNIHLDKEGKIKRFEKKIS